MTARLGQAGASLLARTFAAAGWLAACAGGIGAIALRMIDPVPVLPNTFGFGDVALIALELMGAAFASVGALLVIRRPGNAVGWCMVIIGVGYADGGLAAAVTYSAAAHAGHGGGMEALAAWFTTALTTIGGLTFALPFIFPTGRGQNRTWDALIRLSIPTWTLIPFVIVLQPGPLHLFPSIANPFGVLPDLRALVGFSYSQLITVGAVVVAPVVGLSIITRYRSSQQIERQQLKWFLLANVISVIGVAVAAAGAVLSDGPPGEAGLAVFGFSGALVPVAIGIAILRYHLYEIDRLISRTVVYAVVTGVLGTAFAGLILVLQWLLTAFTQGQTIAVASSTLVVFALFQPVRRRVQRAVDRRFDRARYDADRTIQSLAGRLGAELDLATLSKEIARTADVAVRPATVAVWLRSAPR